MGETCRDDWIAVVGSDTFINGLKVIFKEYYTNTIAVNVTMPWGGTLDMDLTRGVELTKFNPDESGSYFTATYIDDWVTTSGIGVKIKICKFTAPVVPPAEEDRFAPWIGTITSEPHKDWVGEDEITFKIPVSNHSSEKTYNYVKLFDASGVEIAQAPLHWWTYKSISPGDTEIITITSKDNFRWSIQDVHGQTVTFKLFSSFSRSDLQQAYMKHFAVPAYDEEPPVECPIWDSASCARYGEDCELGPECSDYGSSGIPGWTPEQWEACREKCEGPREEEYEEVPYVPPVEPPYVPPVEPPDEHDYGEDALEMIAGLREIDLRYDLNGNGFIDTGDVTLLKQGYPLVSLPIEPPTDEEDDVLMYIALFAIAYIMFSNG